MSEQQSNGISWRNKRNISAFWRRNRQNGRWGTYRYFLESAAGLITRYAFVLTKEEKATLENFMKSASALGITSVVLSVYSDMGKSDAQTVRIHAALDLLGDLAYAERCRKKYHSDKLRVDHLKQFLDGVSTTHTALMLDHYADAPGDCGIPLSDLNAIAEAVQKGHK